MICWIHKKDLDSYRYLCEQEGTNPYIIEETEDKAHVGMTNSVANTWMSVGYWVELG